MVADLVVCVGVINFSADGIVNDNHAGDQLLSPALDASRVLRPLRAIERPALNHFGDLTSRRVEEIKARFYAKLLPRHPFQAPAVAPFWCYPLTTRLNLLDPVLPSTHPPSLP